jgi:hypothetical protein
MFRPIIRKRLLSLVAVLSTAALLPLTASRAQPVRSTEDFLNTLGVNTHLGGLTAGDPWNTDPREVGKQLNYIGVRLVRDWPYSADYGQKLAAVRNSWRPDGKFWLSVVEGSPAEQRSGVEACARIAKAYPGMIYATGGGNEEDDEYAQKLGATLPDTAVVQAMLYRELHPLGVVVSQCEFGAGWTAANNWDGDYDPNNTGIHQNYNPGPADLGGSHLYLIDPHRTMGDTLKEMRRKAQLCSPGKPVAHTEVGAYYNQYKMPASVFGQALVMGAFESFAAGDAGYIMYGLQDSAPESTYGFYTYPGGVAHPSAEYYHTMATLLASGKGGYAPGDKPTFTPGSLNAAFSSSETQHVVMQKPTGEFVIADWSEQAPTQDEHETADTVTLGRRFADVAVYDIERGVAPIVVAHDTDHVTLTMEPNDTYLIVLK